MHVTLELKFDGGTNCGREGPYTVIFFGSGDQSRNPFGRYVTGQKMGYDFMKDFKILCKITV